MIVGSAVRVQHGDKATEPPLVEVLSIPVTSITSDPSKLRALIRMPNRLSPEGRRHIQALIAAWFSGESPALILEDGADLSFVLLDGSEPTIVEAK